MARSRLPETEGSIKYSIKGMAQLSASIYDVARYCGLPVITVRRILDNSLLDVTDRTRRKVLRAAKMVGYDVVPRTHNLGMIYMDENGKGLTHPYFAALLNAFKSAAENWGYDITFINHNATSENMTYLDHCRYRNVDGVCLACLDFTSREVSDLVASDIPCVTVDHMFEGIPAVLSDNENGVNMLVDFAASLGHRRIAFIHGHNNSVVTSTRIAQFYSAMAYHGLPVPEGYVRSGLYNEIGMSRDIILDMLRMSSRPTCILLPNDMCYFGAQEAAQVMGLRIPEDISFAGYDGIELTQALRPQLTTISQDSTGMGRACARRLIEMIESPASYSRKPTIFPVELLKGGTIAKWEE